MKVTNTISGFTLIELLMTLSISGLLLLSALALPTHWVAQNKFMHHTNRFLQALEFARSYAVITGSTTTICSSDGSGHCAGNAYEKAWIVFSEHADSVNGTLDHDENILMIQQSDAANISIRSKTFSQFISYDRFGRAKTYNNIGFANLGGRFILCSDSAHSLTEFIISKSGRVRSNHDGQYSLNEDDCLH